MQLGVYVPLTVDAKRKLVELARRERREPRQQASVLLERLLGDCDAREARNSVLCEQVATET